MTNAGWRKALGDCPDRLTLWTRILTEFAPASVLEVGVWKGAFAAHMLQNVPSITRYYMLDPWRKLPDWNKPANVDDKSFSEIRDQAIAATRFAADRVVELRGTTVEKSDDIPDASLDFAYIDGDHTLRGITVDLIRIWSKVKPGGILAGDDLSPTIWQHDRHHEPTLVFPFAAYFAEAVGAPFLALPFHQFLIERPANSAYAYRFNDLAGAYQNASLRTQFSRPPALPRFIRRVARQVIGRR